MSMSPRPGDWDYALAAALLVLMMIFGVAFL